MADGLRYRIAAGLSALLALTWPAIGPASAAEGPPKRGGTLTYLIPADAPPSFDGHRETTFATVQSVAPYYSVLMRINPKNSLSTTDFVCDLCTAIPAATDDGKTYTFKIRDNVKFHNGKPFTSADVKYTFDELFKSNSFKSKAFFDIKDDTYVQSIKAAAVLPQPSPEESGKTCGLMFDQMAIDDLLPPFARGACPILISSVEKFFGNDRPLLGHWHGYNLQFTCRSFYLRNGVRETVNCQSLICTITWVY